MILRRFIEHVSSQNWFAVGIDVVVVIVGIFLGTQVTNWNEQRLEAKQEVSYLSALNEDLKRLNIKFEDKIEFEVIKARLANRTYELLSNDEGVIDADKVSSALIGLSDRRTVNFASPVYIDLLSSGKLILIRNDKLRKDIIAFFTNLEHYQIVLEKNSKHHIDEMFIPFIRKQVSYRRITDDLSDELIAPIDRQFDNRTDALLPSGIMNQDDELMSLPIDAPEWRQIKRELSWRAMIAVADGDFVENILKSSESLSQEIDAYLSNISQ